MFNQFYDIITFYDSLEHFEEIEFVKKLKCNYICISVPNCHYKNDEWFRNWKHRKPNEHLWHFNSKSHIRPAGWHWGRDPSHATKGQKTNLDKFAGNG